jgi:hypothetical protein
VGTLSRISEQVDSLVAAEQRHIDLLFERRRAVITAAVTGDLDVAAEAA